MAIELFQSDSSFMDKYKLPLRGVLVYTISISGLFYSGASAYLVIGLSILSLLLLWFLVTRQSWGNGVQFHQNKININKNNIIKSSISLHEISAALIDSRPIVVA